ncbi:hypothetical protein COLO4_03833 [Corchorus olitorius]|uniref:Uncharacterized protein n=1 Tax=Corchorus olitorius TaxID=93759 RepID=A0A1R3KWI6_9ROSI|nr:hypothetical protein COLO4_03833 [Corchorus olitorius]
MVENQKRNSLTWHERQLPTKDENDYQLSHGSKNNFQFDDLSSGSVVKGKGKAVDGGGLEAGDRKAILASNFEKVMIKVTPDLQEDNVGSVEKLNADFSAKVVLSDGDNDNARGKILKINLESNLPMVERDEEEVNSKLNMGLFDKRMEVVEPVTKIDGNGPNGEPVFQFQTAASETKSTPSKKWKREARVVGGRPNNSSPGGNRVVSGNKRGSMNKGSREVAKRSREYDSIASENRDEELCSSLITVGRDMRGLGRLLKMAGNRLKQGP